MKRLLPGLLLLAVCLSCSSVPKEIPADTSPHEFFQSAQIAMERGDYRTALYYYNTFIERYSNDKARVVEAQYEIADIYRKQGKTAEAKKLFAAIIEKYRGEDAALLPIWVQILSRKLLEKIQEKETPALSTEGQTP